jgi:hypothetical protein
MIVKLQIYYEVVDPEHFKYLLTGNLNDVEVPENPPFVDALAWSQM